MKIRTIMAGIAGSLLVSSMALAADVVPMPVFAPAPAPVPVDHTFDYTGFYTGVGFALGGLTDYHLGYNFTPGNLVLGVEGQLGGGVATYLGARARVGLVLGADDRALVYGTGGFLYTGGIILTASAGLEYAVTDRLSVFNEAEFITALGLTYRTGINFHIDRARGLASTGYDWSGPYAGASYVIPNVFLGEFGINWARGNLVFGVSGVAGGSLAPSLAAGGIARAGVALGTDDRTLVYLGLGALFSPGGFQLISTTGVEFAITDRFSIYDEALSLLGGTITLRTGFNFHFGN